MNIYELSTLKSDDEIITVLAENDHVRIERIVSTGQTSDWYDQEEYEFVLLLAGEANLEYEGNQHYSMKKGDTLLIAPHQKHRVTYTSKEPPCVWLCVFYEK